MGKKHGLADRKYRNPPELGFLLAGAVGWFCIECPLINFSSLDSAEIEKFQKFRPALFLSARKRPAPYVLRPASRPGSPPRVKGFGAFVTIYRHFLLQIRPCQTWNGL